MEYNHTTYWQRLLDRAAETRDTTIEVLAQLEDAMQREAQLQTALSGAQDGYNLALMQELCANPPEGKNAEERKRAETILVAELRKNDPTIRRACEAVTAAENEISALKIRVQIMQRRLSALGHDADMIAGLAASMPRPIVAGGGAGAG